MGRFMNKKMISSVYRAWDEKQRLVMRYLFQITCSILIATAALAKPRASINTADKASLDYEVTHGPGEFRNTAVMQRLARSVQPGRFIPVIWAHHDDGQYIGAPLRLYRNFGSKLENSKAGGFGIIHWMTHPLDIFFASHSRQNWSASKDEDARATANWMAACCFGEANRESMGSYLHDWSSSMPFFGRETSDFFIDRPMQSFADPQKAMKDCEDRLAILAQADSSRMTESQKPGNPTVRLVPVKGRALLCGAMLEKEG